MSPNTRIIPFFKPYIRTAEIRAVRRAMRSGWLTTGPQACLFEQEFADFLTKDSPGEDITALAVNSATSGLHLALEAAGIKPGDIVAVPTMTFTATAEVLQYLGADPVFVDSSVETGNMDPEELEKVLFNLGDRRKKLKAVIAVHLAGLPCDMNGIRAAMGKTKAVIIEDAAHSFPSRTSNGMAGTLGDIGVFSFYVTKTITTGEGGMLVTRNQAFADRIRIMRLHGIDRAVWNRYSSKAKSNSWEYDVVEAGFKYNLTDMAASMGRVQLKRADSLLHIRRKIVDRYNSAFKDLPGIIIPKDGEGHAHHLYILTVRDREMRDYLISALTSDGIGSSMHFIPLHRMTYWKKSCQLKAKDYPVAEKMADCNLSLPLWPGMSNREIERVIRSVKKAIHGK